MDVPANTIKEMIAKQIDSRRERLIEISHIIHSNPELSFEELETSKLLISELAKCPKFMIETEVGGLATAFKATLKGKRPGPTVAILAEYDALPRVGHACGHNIIGTSAVGAGLALAEIADELCGKIEIIGTPAEEGGGGKIIMLNRGVFDGLDAVLMMHPSLNTFVCPRLLAMRSLPIEFHGISAHGAQSPHEGRNALGAVIQTFNGIDTLRQHIRMDARIHGIIVNGGEKPNVIPSFASCTFMVRAADDSYLDDLMERVKNCARGAALMTDTVVEFGEPECPDHSPYRFSPTIARYYVENVEALGEKVIGIDEKYVYASNDIGNMSQRVPTVVMMFRISIADKLPDHSLEFAEAAISPLADEAIVLAAKSMAMTAMDLIANPSIIEKAKAELHLSE